MSGQMKKSELQTSVEKFGCTMLRKLLCHPEREWRPSNPRWLHARMNEEAAELAVALLLWTANPTRENVSKVRDEAADVANFAMMISDVVASAPCREAGVT